MMTMNSGLVSWKSKLQSTVSLSTTKAEYIASVEAGKEIKWMHSLLDELGYRVWHLGSCALIACPKALAS
jgi:hypothetical protein